MPPMTSPHANRPTAVAFDVAVPTGSGTLHARFSAAASPSGWVIVGSSRGFSHINLTGKHFEKTGLGTIHLPMIKPERITPRPEADTATELTHQLVQATRWLRSEYIDGSLPIGLFGAYFDAGIALNAAAFLGEEVGAVVAFQGRPDRYLNHLDQIQSPTLLVVNDNDKSVLKANAQANWWLRCTHQLALVSGRSRLLREKSATQQVNDLASAWYYRYLLGHHPLKDFPGQLMSKSAAYQILSVSFQ